MPYSQMITDGQDEQTVVDLFRDADQIQVPIFQREYVWGLKEFKQLLEDIELIRSGQERSQFLGAIVSYENKREQQVIGRLKTLSIVDGQQRILTLYIFMIAIVEAFALIEKKDEAFDIVNEFLLIPPRRGLEVNTRVFPSYADVNQFRIICDKINTPEVLQNNFQTEPINPPPPSGNSSGNLLSQYNRIYKFLQREMVKDDSQKNEFLEEMFDIIVRKLSFVHLLLNDASSANKIFERLNFRGRRVGTIDLVRNEIFTGFIDNPTEAKRIFNSVWNPFVLAFNGHSDQFFFPYCLIHNSNTTQSDIFTHLRTIWNSWNPEKIVSHMTRYQSSFMSIHTTGTFLENEKISLRLDRFVRMRRPSSVYPFVMSMLDATREEKITTEQCANLLDALESFLVRRAIIGFEPTGLHALFKGLWSQIKDNTIDEFKQIIAKKPTIQWPSDQDIIEAIKTRSLAKTKICNYLLVEYDRDLPGDNPSSPPTIEHILPQSYDIYSDWAEIFTKNEHRRMKDTWANLIPLSVAINSSLQASSYSLKKEKYIAESMFITPRRVANTYPNWNTETINQRAENLCNWAINRWPHHL